MQPCPEDPTKQCNLIEMDPNVTWEDVEKKVRQEKFGALFRSTRGDPEFKNQLPAHLEQEANNSLFSLAFRSAQGIFDEHQSKGMKLPRMMIWLSDGKADNQNEEARIKRIISELAADNVAVEAVVFGKGDTRLAKEAGIDVRKTSNPAELMETFAAVFRRIVGAPYGIDNSVSEKPQFQMMQHIEKAWIVVYGDNTLDEVELDGPGMSVKADYAADNWPTAGAYKVAYIENPKAGAWTARAKDGGPGVAYAVVQLSSIRPVLIEPKTAFSETPVLMVVGIRSAQQGDCIKDPELLKDAVITAQFQGQKITLVDNGTKGDTTANDSRFSSEVRFKDTGEIPVSLNLKTLWTDRTVDTKVSVSGSFTYAGDPVELDLGTLTAGQDSCKPLDWKPEQKGDVPFELELMNPLPEGRSLESKLPDGSALKPGEGHAIIRVGDNPQVCLRTSKEAESSVSQKELWLSLHVANSKEPQHQVKIHLSWVVKGLTFLQRWGWLILSILALLIVLFILGGYIVPQRFQPAMALTFVPDIKEIDEQTPQPIKQWKGVGIGFYRNARAFLHADFRISGKAQGALATLQAEKGGARVLPSGMPLFRETIDGEWEDEIGRASCRERV